MIHIYVSPLQQYVIKIVITPTSPYSLHWRHNGHDSVSNHQPHDCLLNRVFRRRSKKISKLCVNGLCAGNSPETGEFPAQMVSNAEYVSIWSRHHSGWRYLVWDPSTPPSNFTTIWGSVDLRLSSQYVSQTVPTLLQLWISWLSMNGRTCISVYSSI